MNILTIAILSLTTLLSPDGRTQVSINADRRAELSYSVSHDGKQVLAQSSIALTLEDGTVLAGCAKPLKTIRRSVDRCSAPAIYKKSQVRDHFNEVEIQYKTYAVVFRAYDEGIAYRFVSRSTKPVKIGSEKAEFNFVGDPEAILPYIREDRDALCDRYQNSFENLYTISHVSDCPDGKLAFLPVAVKAGDVTLCISESDLLHYPGMFLTGNGEGLKGCFAPVAKTVQRDGYEQIEEYVTSRCDYIAEIAPAEKMPWRVIGIADSHADLLSSDLVYNLATPAADVDWSWVKPGKAAWEWWHDWSLRGVDFKSGINTRTYEYYIDFAAAFGLEYMLVDAGWNVHNSSDLFAVVPEMDIKHIVDYAAERGVGIVLWAGYSPFNRQMEEVCKHYSEMGVKGFKVDFMDRDDQDMVDFFRRAAETTARYHLTLDFHGAFKPAGLTRTYPNVLNFEGVYAQENLKWTTYELQSQPAYDCTIPFVRMFGGPIDYNNGAFRNAVEWNFRPVYNEPMSYGTRTHQVAEYIVFDSYFTMLSDSPAAYYADSDCTRFIADIPVVWDETIGLSGEITDHVIMARRSGNDWYIGGLCNWDWRENEISLDFMPEGRYRLTVCQDGVNTHKVASDYVIRSTEVEVRKGDTLRFPMASGGGFAARYEKL